MTSVQMRFVSWRWWGRSSPPCGPLTASALGAIDGGAINLIKRGRSIWFHRDYRYFTILTVSSWHRGSDTSRRKPHAELEWGAYRDGGTETTIASLAGRTFNRPWRQLCRNCLSVRLPL